MVLLEELEVRDAIIHHRPRMGEGRGVCAYYVRLVRLIRLVRRVSSRIRVVFHEQLTAATPRTGALQILDLSGRSQTTAASRCGQAAFKDAECSSLDVVDTILTIISVQQQMEPKASGRNDLWEALECVCASTKGQGIRSHTSVVVAAHLLQLCNNSETIGWYYRRQNQSPIVLGLNMQLSMLASSRVRDSRTWNIATLHSLSHD
ncbi:hypothetical protein C2E23DRAFT_338663 [Lenzites betulinus]|nr:hypothetical protein C2E23DRAFT_338663 [Lenzites betulinus]